jgi:hypothetical protein
MLKTTRLVGFGSGGGVLTITKVTANVASVASASDTWFEIWSDSGGSPSAQIGSDSETKDVNSTGDWEFNFTTPVPKPAAGSPFWVIIQASDGDVNWSRDNDTTPASGVTGGDFEASSTITNLVSATTIMPRFVITYSDLTTDGNSAGTTPMGIGANLTAGLLITNT